MSIVHNTMVLFKPTYCQLTVKNCGAQASVMANINGRYIKTRANNDGIALLELKERGTYLVHSTISRGTYTFILQDQETAEITLHTLPDEYQEVSFLQSSGSQNIKVNFKTTPNMAIETKVRPMSAVNAVVFGSAWDSSAVLIHQTTSSTFTCYWGSSSLSYSAPINRDYTIIYQKRNISVNGDARATSADPTVFGELYLLGLPSYYSQMRMYYFRLYEQGKLIRNMIPCYRKADNAPGMFDIVYNVFYVNSNTGQFILGPEVLYPEEVQQIEYLESSGTQYINTEMNLLDNMLDIDIDFQVTNTSISGAIMSDATSGGSTNGGPSFRVNGGNFTVLNPGVAWNNIQTADTNRHQIHWNINNTTSTISGDLSQSISPAEFGNGRAWRTNAMISLFGDVSAAYCSAKIWDCIIKFNSILQMHLVPSKKISTNVLGMYDIVTHQFFINKGTGGFIGGDVIE